MAKRLKVPTERGPLLEGVLFDVPGGTWQLRWMCLWHLPLSLDIWTGCIACHLLVRAGGRKAEPCPEQEITCAAKRAPGRQALRKGAPLEEAAHGQGGMCGL